MSLLWVCMICYVPVQTWLGLWDMVMSQSKLGFVVSLCDGNVSTQTWFCSNSVWYGNVSVQTWVVVYKSV